MNEPPFGQGRRGSAGYWLVLGIGAPVMVVVSILLGRFLAQAVVGDAAPPALQQQAGDPGPFDPSTVPDGPAGQADAQPPLKVVAVERYEGEEDPREAARRAIEEARQKQGPLSAPPVAKSQDELDPSVFGEEAAGDGTGLDRAAPVTKGGDDQPFFDNAGAGAPTAPPGAAAGGQDDDTLVDTDPSNAPSFIGNPLGGAEPPRPRVQPQDAPSVVGGDEPPSVAVPGGYTVQVASFKSRDSALSLKAELAALGYAVNISQVTMGGEDIFKVRVGRYTTREGADEAAGKLRQQNYPGFVQEL